MSYVPLNIDQIKAIVFDLDNTLVSSDMDFRWLREQIGCPLNLDLLSYVEQLDCTQQQQYASALILQHEQEDAQSSHPMPGCLPLLEFIETHALHTAVITRNCEQATHTKLAHNGLSIPVVITREQFPPKPAPDSLQYLAKKWDLASYEVLYVGDYLYDLQAAFNADMPSCLVTHGNDTPFHHHASIVVEQLTDLRDQFYRSFQTRR
ncbi:HAD family hydrolase [Vibrio aquaticus]|uniref:HAD family hydrolase n=1 Tax=Vibrio aquaticus TaxID=2496559 RepID=A0A432D2P8_9VIBR|nr:HAD-IA family hydrolase [Vibrio aquaticus]RTZ18234.1 HAD family hydrolase [Vibrio aquaticus]